MSWQDDLTQAIAQIPLAIEQNRTELATGVAQFQNGIRLQGARYQPVGASQGGRNLPWAGQGRLVGWSLRATGGAVSVDLRDSRDDAGDTIATIDLAAGSSQTIWLGPGGISIVEGLRVVPSGAGVLTGAVYIGAVD
jgi:hypothetical protein